MEATGDYWKGPLYRLEAEGFECVLADAKQVRHLPGRPKRDPADSRWLAACFERGAVTPCFVATGEFRVIRLHTRYRRDLTEERTREKQRAEKLLESAQLTELRVRIAVSGGLASAWAVRFRARDQRRGWRTGSAVAEGAALRSA
jgi:transposase